MNNIEIKIEGIRVFAAPTQTIGELYKAVHEMNVKAGDFMVIEHIVFDTNVDGSIHTVHFGGHLKKKS